MNYPSVFISYCWANSHEACSITTEAKEGSLGHGDPRALKKYLEKKGLQCWLDIEQMGKVSTFIVLKHCLCFCLICFKQNILLFLVLYLMLIGLMFVCLFEGV